MGNRGSSVREIPQKFTETQYPQENNQGLINKEQFIDYNNNYYIIFIKLFLLIILLLTLYYSYRKVYKDKLLFINKKM